LAAEAEEEDKHAEQDKYAEEDEAEEAVHEAEEAVHEAEGAAHEVDAVQILEQANPLCLVCVLVPDGPGPMPKQQVDILDGDREFQQIMIGRAQMATKYLMRFRAFQKYLLQLPIRDRDK
jgi:hypothetical protein